MKLTIKNYRPYSAKHPLKIQIEDGVTAIIGANNSGKSFALKSLFELRQFFNVLGNDAHALIGRNKSQVQFINAAHALDAFHKYNNDDIEVILEADQTKSVISIKRLDVPVLDNVELHINGKNINVRTDLHQIEDNRVVDVNKHKVADISELRKFCNLIRNSIYFPAFRNVINIGAKTDYYDISVGNVFIQKWHEYKTNNNPQIRSKALQVQKDLQQLFGYKRLEINTSPQEHKMIVDINDESYPIADLGSGITQFILVFINAAIRNPSFILIDEPELNLHPKLQIDFINRLLKYTKNGIILATHSLGLAHSVADNIYSITKLNNKESIIQPFENTHNFTELLGELNFSSFPLLGFNKVLLVEGTTDIKLFSVFLHKLKKYKDVLIWPLGGSSMINGITEQEISGFKDRFGPEVKFHCFIDSEKDSKNAEIPKERVDFKTMCESQKINIKLSDKRAIENYLTEQAIKKVKGNKYRVLKPYEKLKDCNPAWSKSENWRIAREMSWDEIKGTDVGEFLDKL